MDIDALKLTARFSMSPNKLGYCGLNTAESRFRKCILEDNGDGIEEEISHFIVLNPYLETLKKITGLDKFSYEIAESYWLGNEELNKATIEDYQILLDNFVKQGVPDWLIEELRQKTPKKFIPTHLFQVLHVGVGRASGSVPFNMKTINNCIVRWGKVESSKSKSLKVDLNSLEESKGGYKLKLIKEEVEIDEILNPGIENGDVVAVHWGRVAKKLTPEEVEKLEYWTRVVLENIEIDKNLER
jgi:hypothetical protein